MGNILYRQRAGIGNRVRELVIYLIVVYAVFSLPRGGPLGQRFLPGFEQVLPVLAAARVARRLRLSQPSARSRGAPARVRGQARLGASSRRPRPAARHGADGRAASQRAQTHWRAVRRTLLSRRLRVDRSAGPERAARRLRRVRRTRRLRDQRGRRRGEPEHVHRRVRGERRGDRGAAALPAPPGGPRRDGDRDRPFRRVRARPKPERAAARGDRAISFAGSEASSRASRTRVTSLLPSRAPGNSSSCRRSSSSFSRTPRNTSRRSGCACSPSCCDGSRCRRSSSVRRS